MTQQDAKRSSNGRLAGKLALIAVGMFGFGFAMWPLYDVFCDITGLNGRGVKIAESATSTAQSDRQVRIRFDATVNSNLPWDFEAIDKLTTVTLGEMSEAMYRATNPTGESLAGHAIFNVTPPEASLYFVKTECFCFNNQPLAAGERKALEALPGVGRKTANVVLNMWFRHPAQAVDTHIFRVGNRTGIAPGKDVDAVERAIEDNVPVEYQLHAHHWLILHGRYTCVARKPKCGDCLIRDLCQFEDKNL